MDLNTRLYRAEDICVHPVIISELKLARYTVAHINIADTFADGAEPHRA